MMRDNRLIRLNLDRIMIMRFMRKIIEIGKAELLEEFLAIFGIGLMDCFQKKILDYHRILNWFYNIYTISYAHVYKFSKEFKKATGLGNEIDAHLEYLQDEDPGGKEMMEKIIDLFQKVIKKSVEQPLDYGYTFLHIDDLFETPKWYEEMEEKKRQSRANWSKKMEEKKAKEQAKTQVAEGAVFGDSNLNNE